MIVKRIFGIVVLLIFSNLSHAFKLDRVILASDVNPAYVEFWPLVAKAWKNIVGIKPTLALIAPADFVIDDTYGDIILIEPIPGIPTSFHAQVIRLLLPAYFENEYCIISDMDMIPLQKDYFVKAVESAPADSFVVFKDGAFDADYFKEYPMCYNAALGKTFKDIFKIKSLTDIPRIVKEMYALCLGWTTDQQILYKQLHNWEFYKTKCIQLGHDVHPRVDRMNWSYDKKLVDKNYYIDSHMPKPYTKHKEIIDALFSDVMAPLLKKETKVKPSMVKGRNLADPNYGTHMVPLATVVAHTSGPVLELGCGDFSTPLLHAICSVNKRLLVSTDTDKKWLSLFLDLENEWHKFIYVPVYTDDLNANPQPKKWDTIGTDVHWAVVLVDHRPGERRIEDVQRLRSHTDIFVVHDTQQPTYGYEPILSTFKYKYIYERYTTTTTLVSDTIDIAALFE